MLVLRMEKHTVSVELRRGSVTSTSVWEENNQTVPGHTEKLTLLLHVA